MARQVERLSSAKVKHAKVGLHPDGGGLYLQVTAVPLHTRLPTKQAGALPSIINNGSRVFAFTFTQ